MIIIKTDENKKGVFITEQVYTDSMPGHETRKKEFIDNAKAEAKRRGYNIQIEKLYEDNNDGI